MTAPGFKVRTWYCTCGKKKQTTTKRPACTCGAAMSSVKPERLLGSREGLSQRLRALEAQEDRERNARLRALSGPVRRLCPDGCTCLMCQLAMPAEERGSTSFPTNDTGGGCHRTSTRRYE